MAQVRSNISQLHNLDLGWWRNCLVQKSCETVCRAEPHEIRKVKLKRLDCWDRGLKEAKHEHENQKILKRVGLWQVSHTENEFQGAAKASPLPPKRPLPGLQRAHGENSIAETTSGSLILTLLGVELTNNIPINNCFVLLISIYLAYYSVFVQCSRCPNKRLKARTVLRGTFLVQTPPCHTPHLFSWYQKHSAQLSRELLWAKQSTEPCAAIISCLLPLTASGSDHTLHEHCLQAS